MTEAPRHWETDAVLADGGTVHVRPIRPDDKDRLVDLHGRLSDRTIYYRFFSPHPRLTPREVERFTTVDHEDRVALVAQTQLAAAIEAGGAERRDQCSH